MQSGGNRRAFSAAAFRRVALSLALVVTGGACREPGVAPAPPGGDRRFVLDETRFADTVSPVFAAEGCNTVLCHGGGPRGSFELSPPGDPDVAFDFAEACRQVYGWDPLASPLLLKPLSQEAGGVGHAGEAMAGFDSTDDPGYLAMRDWILAGEWQ